MGISLEHRLHNLWSCFIYMYLFVLSSLCSVSIAVSFFLLFIIHLCIKWLSFKSTLPLLLTSSSLWNPGIVKFFNSIVMWLLLWFSLSSGKLRTKPYTNTFKDSDDPWAIFNQLLEALAVSVTWDSIIFWLLSSFVKHSPSMRLTQHEKVVKQYLIGIVLVSVVSNKFSFIKFQYGALTRS